MTAMPKPRPPHLRRERTRHGKDVWYFQRSHGPRTRLRADYDTPEFWAEYSAALADVPPTKKSTATLGTIAWAVERYMASSAWRDLSQSTRRRREAILRPMTELYGDRKLTAITNNTIVNGKEALKDKPNVANDYIKTMRHFFRWACDPGGGNLLTTNPTTSAKYAKVKSDGYHTWIEQQRVQYEQRWERGTMQRLALDIMIHTAFSRGDSIRLGPKHVSDGWITIRMVKNRGDGEVSVPMLTELAASIAATKCGNFTYLATKSGAPMTPGGFSKFFKTACRKAGLPDCCNAHGLRKYAITRLAEGGANQQAQQAWGGWKNDPPPTYTAKANRKKLAAEVAHLLIRTENK